MSIKGSGGELFLGKQEATIITFWGNKIKIPYDNLKRIDYSYFKFGDGGYIDFVDLTNRLRRFEFAKKANEPVSRAITFMQENNPELDFVEHNPNDLKFYQKSWFIQYQNVVTAKSEFQQSYENIMQSVYGEGNNVVESVSDTTVYPDTIPDTGVDSGDVLEYNVGDVFESNEIKIMFIDSGDYSTDNEFLQPASGNKYIYAEFSVYNIGESDYSVGSVSFDCYADDTLCSQSILTVDDAMSSIATVSPDRNIKGKIYYEVPKDSNKIEIEFETDFLSQDKVYFIVK